MASILKVDQIQESTTGVGTNFSTTGSATTPTISLGNQTNKGFYHAGSDKIGFAIGGNKVGEIGAGYGGFTGNIIQVLQTIKSDNFTASPSSFVDITGLSVLITPKYINSKILVLFDISVGGVLGSYIMFNLLRDSTNIYQPTTSKTYMATKVFYVGNGGSDNPLGNTNGIFFDSPNTISSITYKIQARNSTSGSPFYINRRGSDDTALSSSITVMEVQQ
jgi:hypothetical protein